MPKWGILSTTEKESTRNVTYADYQWHKKQVKATSKAKSEETRTFQECVANLTVLRVRVGFFLLLAAYWQVIAATL